MNTTEELERLVSLRDRGDLTQAEFEKAKTRLLSTAPIESKGSTGDSHCDSDRKAFPGIGLAIGVFVGNLLAVSSTSGNIVKGMVVGAIAAVLVIIISLVLRAVKAN